jgi:serine/threonine protein kinase/Tol biopolymer transport system component
MGEPLTPATRLGRYDIVALLGSGGMGEVYRAHDAELGRTVAIKILPKAFHDHPDRLRRFELEARAAAALNHPNILAVYDVGRHDGTPYIVSELLEGQSLRARLDGAALPLRKAIEFGIQIAEGLAAAHDKGIVHRDLKPENIFVTLDDRLKILDFGLAKLAGVDSATLTAVPHTAAGVVLGTVGYLSPEQASGLPADHRSDIFSMGAMLFEMVTHRRAFARATAAQTLTAVLEDDPTASIPAGVGPSARVMNLVRRCLDKSMERRFQSARDLSLVLANELSDGSLGQPGFARLRAPHLSTLALAFFCVAIGTLIGWTIFRSPVQFGGAQGDAPTRLTISLPADLPSSYGSPVAISPDGKKVAVVMGAEGTSQLFVRQLDRDDLMVLPGTGGAEFPFFSPDGEWVGFWSGNRIHKVSTRGGSPIALADSPSAPFRGADWGDDIILFAPFNIGPLSRVASSGGDAQPATTLDRTRGEYSHRWPQILPGGRAWVYTAVTGKAPAGLSSVMLHVRSTGETRELLAGALYARYVGDGLMLFVHDGQLFVQRFDVDRLALAGGAQSIQEPVVTRAVSGATFLSVSNQGAAVFVKGARESDRTLLWVDRGGAAQPIGAAPARYAAPRISPDGRRLALMISGSFGGTGDLFVLDLDTSVRTRLTLDGSVGGNKAWSADGHRLLFNSQRDGPSNVFVQAADGTGTAERIMPDAGFQSPSSWLQDGNTISYVQGNPKTGADIWAMRLSDRTRWPLVLLPANQYGGRISPDGRWLAYTDNTSGITEAFITTYPRPGSRWQVSAGGGQEVSWSPDSREMYFRHDTRMFAVRVAADGNPPAGRANVLFEGRYLYEPNNPGLPHYDVAPDGRFLMISSDAGPPDQVQVVLNWTKYLAARLVDGQ